MITGHKSWGWLCPFWSRLAVPALCWGGLLWLWGLTCCPGPWAGWGEAWGGQAGAGRSGGSIRALTLLQIYPHCVWEGDLSLAGSLPQLLFWTKPAIAASRAMGRSSVSQSGGVRIWGGGCRQHCLTGVADYSSAPLAQIPQWGWDIFYRFLWISAKIFLCSWNCCCAVGQAIFATVIRETCWLGWAHRSSWGFVPFVRYKTSQRLFPAKCGRQGLLHQLVQRCCMTDTGRTEWCLAETLMLIFFQRLAMKQFISGGGDLPVSHKTSKVYFYVLHCK